MCTQLTIVMVGEKDSVFFARFKRFLMPVPTHRWGSDLSARRRLLWTVGNLCMLMGVVVFLYVGGLYTTEAYNRYAARGDSDVPAPIQTNDDVVEPAPFVSPAPVHTTGSTGIAQSRGEALEWDEIIRGQRGLRSETASTGQVVSQVPVVPQVPKKALVTRLVIPSIKVDSKVVEVGWEVVEQNGQQVAVWQVAKYAVGQHRGSANPGEDDNIVMAGHVGGYGFVFRDLYYVRAGEKIIIYTGEQKFTYTIKERLVVDEEGVPAEQRAANARYIESTGSELVTLVTCWPATGPMKFTQRVIVRAVPAEPALPKQVR